VAGWVNALANGLAPTQVAYGFAASAEREGQRITADYQTFLGRAPAAEEVASWVNAFAHGLANETVVAGFVGSTEYFQRHAGNLAVWLHNAYLDILGRPADDGGFWGWLGVLEGG
jgi:hypothetical protein